MSDTKETKKKGFFSKLLGRSDAADADKKLEKSEILKGSAPSLDSDSEVSSAQSNSAIKSTLSKSALAKMKKADIVAAASELGVDLDIKLTKDKLLAAWDTHFNQDSKSALPTEEPIAEETVEEPVVEEVTDEPIEESLSDSNDPTEEESQSEAVTVSLDEDSPVQIIKTFESNQLRDDIPSFRPGDTVVVSVKVKEGERTRLQAFEGVVMNIKNRGLNSAFIVRKISSGIGVERTFQLHSPMIDSIKVKKIGRASCRERV